MAKQDYLELADFLKTGKINPENLRSIFYRGFGQLSALRRDPQSDVDWDKGWKSYQPLVANIHQYLEERYEEKSEDVLNGLKRAANHSYFTPDAIVSAMVSALDLSKVTNVLDPSAGTGNFLAALPDDKKITALEPETLSHEVLTQLYPNAQCLHGRFQDVPLETYDLIISNIPFGDLKVTDRNFLQSGDAIKVASMARIHNYFFVKAIDHLNPDGFIVFLTSTAFADSPGNRQLRSYLMDKCTLRAMVRLPMETFKTAGTLPTTDVLILQQRAGRPMSQMDKQFITSPKQHIAGQDIAVNGFIGTQPDSWIGEVITEGQYGNHQFALTSKQDLDEIAVLLRSKLIAQFNGTFTTPTQTITPNSAKPKTGTRLKENQVHRYSVPGNLFVYRSKVYHLDKDKEGYYLTPIKSLKNIDLIQGLIQLRIIYLTLLDAEKAELAASEISKIRGDLNHFYETFTFQYGPLNGQRVKQVIELDSQAHLILGLETEKEKGYGKADIFLQSLNAHQEQEVEVKTLSDAIVLSLNKHNGLNLEFLAESMNQTPDEIIYQGVADGLIFLEPGNSLWVPVTKDKFLSGDMYSKEQKIADDFPGQYLDLKDQHLTLVQDNIPALIPFELIDINLGERWIDRNLYTEFLSDFFEEDTQVIYTSHDDKYRIKTNREGTVCSSQFFVQGVSGNMDGLEIVQHAFNDTNPYLSFPHPDFPQDPTKRQADNNAIRLAQDKIEQVHERFLQWLTAKASWQSLLEESYNRLFNNTVPRIYDGSHLELEGLQLFTPWLSQKNAVYRTLQQNGGICDHKVGAGKSLIMAIAAFEMKRLGVANKPLIIAMKANVESIYREFKKAYPFSKVLHPKEKDFRGKNRRLLFQRMMNNHWDAVIISHSQFKMIPQCKDIERDILKQELAALSEDLRVLTDEMDIPTSNSLLKGLEKRKENMEARIERLDNAIKRDEFVMDFETLGFDHLFVDESHEFKNLHYTTRHTSVSGLGSPSGSQRAHNLLIACRTIQRKLGGDKGITFLSGTILSNSLVELYLIFKYLRPNALEKLQIRSFDAWAKVYARKSYEFEFTVTNEIKRKERFREFIKVPELAAFYTEITDVVNDNNFNESKPQLVNHIVNIEPTDSQKEFMQRLVEFARTQEGHHIGKPFLTDNEKTAYMLIATNLAKKMSLDMRLIDSKLLFQRGSKIDIACQNVNDIYQRTGSFLGTQLIFCDLSTPKPKLWSVYQDIKNHLIKTYDIPVDEVAFIHDAQNVEQRKELKSKVNAGKIRILIGSTTKLGVGNNVQEKIVAMHHLDICWKPSEFEQRNGRGARPGNKAARDHNDNKVHNYIYAVSQSLDTYQFNICENKQRFINQIKNNSIKVRRLDEGSMSGDSGDQQMNFAEYVALLSGNNTLLDKLKIDKQLKDVQMQYDNYITETRAAVRRVDTLQRRVERIKQNISSMELDLMTRTELEYTPDPIHRPHKRYYYPKPVVAGQDGFYDPKRLGERIKRTLSEPDRNFRATYGPFSIQFDDKGMYVQGPGEIPYRFSNGDAQGEVTWVGKYIKNALDTIDSSLRGNKRDLKRYNKDLSSYKAIADRQFDKLDLLSELKKESKLLEDLIANQVPDSEGTLTEAVA